MSLEQKALLPNWRSPYQEKAYFDAYKKMGFDCEEKEIGGSRMYFYKSGNEMVAWEVSCATRRSESKIPTNYAVHLLTQASSFETLDWKNITYATVYIPTDANSTIIYDHRFTRSLNRAFRYQVRHSIADTDTQINEVLEQFAEFPSRKDELDQTLFIQSVKQYLSAGVASVHAVFLEKPEFVLLGGAVVLKSPSQVNFRYYTNQRTPHNSGHFLLHSMIGHYRKQEDIEIIDLSGISHPDDIAMSGINDFKLQITNRSVGFSKI